MLDRLFDFLASLWTELWPVYIVREYQAAVQLRLGRYKRTVGPGWYWAWPFLETALVEDVVVATHNLSAQSLTTLDGKSVVVQGVLTSSVRDVRKLLLEVEGKEAVLVDAAMGLISQAVSEHRWDQLHTPGFAELVTKRVRARAFRYGVEVHFVQFSDMQIARSIRLWTHA